jgi:hypothetical protein
VKGKEKDMAQGKEGMKGPGEISKERVNDIIEKYRNNEMFEKDKQELRSELGTQLKPLLNLEPRDVEILNGLPTEAVDTLFHLCTRAASSGGNVDYERHKENYPMKEPKMVIVYEETITHTPGGPAKTVGKVKLTCWK